MFQNKGLWPASSNKLYFTSLLQQAIYFPEELSLRKRWLVCEQRKSFLKNRQVKSFVVAVLVVVPPAYLISKRGRWTIQLTAHNWQKWKRVFLTCPCHKIYRDEAVGLLKKLQIYLKKSRFLWKCEIWGNIVKIWYFVNNCLIEARI